MTIPSSSLDSALGRLEHALLHNTTLVVEFEASRAEFFVNGEPPGASTENGPGSEAALARRRHLEWFLLERPSASLRGVPIERMLHDERMGLERDESDADEEAAFAALLTSFSSVFEVTGVVLGEGVWVRDLAGGGEYALEEPEVSHALAVADLMVGRVYDVGDSLHRFSGAAGFFRDERLLSALRTDFERARETRKGSLRTSQSELEKMFWGVALQRAGSADAARETRQRALEFLIAQGVERPQAEEWLRALARQPIDPENTLPGAGDVLGEVLDELAFETPVELDAARKILLAAWLEMSRREPDSSAPAAGSSAAKTGEEAVDVRAAMEAFDRGRSEGRDLEELFSELERDLGIDEPGDGADQEEAPDFPGVVGAMVEEYLWELGQQAGAEAAEQQGLLRKFAEFGAGIGNFDNVSRRELLVFGCIWVPELGELTGADQARQLLTALEGFCSWCEEQQSHPLGPDWKRDIEGLRENLPRIVEACLHRTPAVSIEAGEVHEVAEVSSAGLVLVDGRGALHSIRVDAALLEHLRAGDRLRAEIDSNLGVARVYCCYPPQSAEIKPK